MACTVSHMGMTGIGGVCLASMTGVVSQVGVTCIGKLSIGVPVVGCVCVCGSAAGVLWGWVAGAVNVRCWLWVWGRSVPCTARTSCREGGFAWIRTRRSEG